MTAGKDPLQSRKARNAAYVALWLVWNVARGRSKRPHGVRI